MARSTTFLDQDVLDEIARADLDASRPFPWLSIERLLTADGFDRLVAEFPPLSLFRWDEGLRGQHYVRPQDRWFLAYEPDRPSAPGSARAEDLPVTWRAFIEELERDRGYRKVLACSTGDRPARPTFNWHVGVTGSEVCPHVDKDSKIATHIFYMNTADDWDASWGGSMQVLDGRPADVEYPDFDDFATMTTVDTLGNASFLFRNTPDAWHGVQPLTCPAGAQRRLFNVVLIGQPAPRRAPVLARLTRRVRTRT
jgi:hypothetical protein